MSAIKNTYFFLQKLNTRPSEKEIIENRGKYFFSYTFRELIHIIKTTQVIDKSAQITFTFILSIVPFLSIVFSFVHYFHGFDHLFTKSIIPLIKGHFGPTAGKEISNYLISVIKNIEVKTLGFISLVTFSVTAFLLLFSMENIFNEIMLVENQPNILKRALKYIGILLLFPFLFSIISVTFEPLVRFFQSTFGSYVESHIVFLGRFSLGFIFRALCFTIIYCIIPSRRLHFYSLFIGGILASFLFEILQYVNIYLARSALNADPHKIYGTVPLIAILFFSWIRLGWLISLIGAAFALAAERIRYPIGKML